MSTRLKFVGYHGTAASHLPSLLKRVRRIPRARNAMLGEGLYVSVNEQDAMDFGEWEASSQGSELVVLEVYAPMDELKGAWIENEWDEKHTWKSHDHYRRAFGSPDYVASPLDQGSRQTQAVFRTRKAMSKLLLKVHDHDSAHS
jgi:hypothetical protein